MCLSVMTMKRTGTAADDGRWESIARFLAGDGTRVVLLYTRDAEGMKKLVADLKIESAR